MDRAISAAPADHGELAVGLTQGDLLRGDALGDAIDFGLAGVGHRLVAFGRIVEVAGAGVLLDPADPVGQARRARLDPRPRALFVAGIGQQGAIGAVAFREVLHRELGIGADIGHRPRLGRVGNIAVGQQDHRGHVLRRDPHRLDRAIEGIAGAAGGDHRDRGIAVAAIDRLIKVALLGLGRQAGRRPAALRVDDYQGQLGHHRQAHRLGLERDTRARAGGDAQMPGVRGANRSGNRGDLILSLEGGDAEFLEADQIVQDRAGRRDRIAAKEHRQMRQLRTGYQPQRDRFGPGDGAIEPGRSFDRIDMALVQLSAEFRGFAIGVPGIKRGNVGLSQGRVLPEFVVEPVDQRRAVAVEHPQRQAQRPHVLAAQRVFVAEPERFDRLNRQRTDIEGQYLPLGEAAILDRADLVLGLFEVALGELTRISDDQPARLERADIGLERRRVHRHQHVRSIASRIDRGRSEVDLERRDAEQRALRRADFRWKVREGGKIIARQRAREGKLPARQLHAVARISRKADDYGFWVICGGCICFGQLRCHLSSLVGLTLRPRQVP